MQENDAVSRITPACTGKTQGLGQDRHHHQDHPRVYGENGPRPQVTDHQLGSPPRVRGKLLRDATHGGDVRITPACTGKTSATFTGMAVIWDHPRVYGENT